MEQSSPYRRCRNATTPETPDRLTAYKRKTRRSIWWNRLYRRITIPTYILSVLFLLVPSVLVILELAGRVFKDRALLGVLALFFGVLLSFCLFIQMLVINYRDLSFAGTFVLYCSVFAGTVFIGGLESDHSLSLTDLAGRYKNNLFTIIELYKEHPHIPHGEPIRPEPYQYTHIDSLAIGIRDHPSIEAFAAYASEKYYRDGLSRALYFRACEILSLYRVIVEDFNITSDGNDRLSPDPQQILEFMQAGHSELTIYFAACLMNLDYLVRVRKNLQGRLVTEVSISTSTYFDLGNFFAHEKWDNAQLRWYMNEFVIEVLETDSYILPLYIPVRKIP